MSTAKTWTIPITDPVRTAIRRKGPMPVIMARNYGVPIYGWRYEEYDEEAAYRKAEEFRQQIRAKDTKNER